MKQKTFRMRSHSAERRAPHTE